MKLPSTTGRWYRTAAVAVTTLMAVTVTNIGVAASAAPPPVGDILPSGTAEVVADSYVVVLKDSVSLQQRGVDDSAKVLSGRYGGKVGHVYRSALHGFEVSLSEAAAKRLAADSAVQYVQRNGVFKTSGIQTNPPSWGLDRVDQSSLPLDGSYTYPNTASTVHAYIIDTGIRLTHSDFGTRATTGFDAVTAGGTAADCNGHGTHVAGTVGGSSYGVAKGVQLVAVRVLNCSGSGTTAQVVAGVDWVKANAVKPAVANMSLGGGADPTIDNAVQSAINSGITFTVSAGNGDEVGNPLNACNFSPARVAAAITVGATDSSDNRASFSNYGSCLDIFAPGVSITSAWNSGNTAKNTIDGTSMAAPHVTGAAALAASANPSWTPQQIRDYLVNGAVNGAVVNPGSGSPNKLLRVANSAPANDFSLSLTSQSGSVTAGGSAATTALTGMVAGSTQNITFSATGLPTGVTVSFNPTSVTTGGSSTVSIKTSASTPSGVYGITIVATGTSVTHTARFQLAVTVSPTSGGKYVPVDAARILDTRVGNGAPVGKIGPAGTLHLQVTGRGGIPASGVTAVVLNVTATNPTTAGYLTVYPTGVTRPTASNLNFPAGWTGANAVTVPVGTGGKVDIFNAGGSVDVIADTLGYYTASGAAAGGLYHRFYPERLIDTRDYGKVGGRQTLQLGLSVNGLPDSGKQIKALALNITAVNPDAGGYLTAYNGLGTVPNASTLNFNRGQIVPNFAIVQTSACPNSPGWEWCAGAAIFGVFNGSGNPTDIIVDLVGFYDDGSLGDGLQFHPVTPTRIADSRDGLGAPRSLGPNSTTTITAPAALQGPNTYALVSNLTGILPTTATYLTVWAAGDPKPAVSNLNLVANEVRPNAAVINLNDAWAYTVYNGGGTVNVAIDVSGTFDYVVFTGSGVNATSSGVVKDYTPTVKRPN
ncbi:S8 family peptidase [Dactylosporangium sp. AC04546]|uniref:S8 family peptidase n=1 Tax=Dactylosporangium sp. AC04546 TaxID=2862460 RepID=UPI0027E02EE1|nr:S8 family peptidase [Dactylosporangium sp. AC04546]WVK83525.1 S8 family peptidase [Dactylosporangium sp. AC04546]